MGLGHSPSIVVDGLILYIDPNNPNCYPGFGNTLYNIVNTSIGGTFVNYTSNPIDNTETRSIFFDGTDDYIDFGSSSSLKLTDNFTLSAWVKSNVYGDRAILGNFGPSSNYSGFNLCIQPNNKIAFLTGSNPSATYLYADNTYLLNTWYHVTGVRRNGTNYLYINGIGQSSTNTQVVATSAQNFYFGKWYSNLTGYYHSGQIGQASLYNRALTATEILQNYNATKKKYSPDENIFTNGLIFYIDPGNINSYPGTGNQIYDLSGFGNTGTLANNPVFSSSNAGQLGYNGTSQYITFGNKFSFTSENFSFTYWVFVNTFTTNQANQGPVVFWKGNFNENGYYCQLNSDGSIGFVTNSPSNQITSSGAGVVKLKYWHHISIVRNGSSVRLYCDGVDVTVTAATHNPAASNRDFLIANYNSFILANIQTSQFQIYNRALTQQEISQNYNATKKRFVNALPPVRNGLVMELDAGQRSSYPGTGNTWYDLSGNGYNYTLTNGPTFSGVGITSSIVFDGSNDRALAVNPISLGTTHTISMIVKPSSAGEDGILFGDIGYSNTGYALYLNSGNYLYYNAGSPFVGSATSTVNNWYMLTVSRNNTSVSLYQNGSLLTAATLGGNDSLTLRSIADFSAGGYPFAGNISQVSCYNRTLSAYEVKQNFDFYRTRYNI